MSIIGGLKTWINEEKDNDPDGIQLKKMITELWANDASDGKAIGSIDENEKKQLAKLLVHPEFVDNIVEALKDGVIKTDELQHNALKKKLEGFSDEPLKKFKELRTKLIEARNADVQQIMSLTLQNQNSLVVFHHFWSTNCSPCLAELSDVVALSKELLNKGFKVVFYAEERPEDHEEAQKMFHEAGGDGIKLEMAPLSGSLVRKKINAPSNVQPVTVLTGQNRIKWSKSGVLEADEYSLLRRQEISIILNFDRLQ